MVPVLDGFPRQRQDHMPRAILSTVKPKDFEQAVLELAMTTRVPLSRANILFYSGVASKQAEKFLDDLMRDGLLEIDSDDDGELVYTVRGVKRPLTGSTALTRCTACGRASVAGTRCSRCGQSLDPRLRALRSELGAAGTALALVNRGNTALAPGSEEEKSLLAAGLLGLFGPFGWLYAGAWREALPAAGAFLIMLKVLPTLMFVILPLLLPASMAVSVLYAWKHNRVGHRSGLLTDDE